MTFLDRFRREPRVHHATPWAPVHPEESDPLMDQVVQACSYDLPGFTVVLQEAEAAWVAATVAGHVDALDEWTSDVFDFEIEQRHLMRLSQIGAQRETRRQDATRAMQQVEAVMTAVALRVADLRDQERQLRDELRQWTLVLTGQRVEVEPILAADAQPPVVARPVSTALPGVLFGEMRTAGESAPEIRSVRPTPVTDDRAEDRAEDRAA